MEVNSDFIRLEFRELLIFLAGESESNHNNPLANVQQNMDACHIKAWIK